MLSVFDIFKIGVGPSSSHTVGPMRIAARFIEDARDAGVLPAAKALEISLHGSLALTGIGHGTDRACLLGLMGHAPDTIDADHAEADLEALARTGAMPLCVEAGEPLASVPFDRSQHLHLRGDIVPDIHPNEMTLSLRDGAGKVLLTETFYSVGGGFIATARQLCADTPDDLIARPAIGPYQFHSAAQLLDLCKTSGLAIADIVLANEAERRPEAETRADLDRLWAVMADCISRGLRAEGHLPGGLEVRRRARALHQKLLDQPLGNEREQLFDWLNVYAMAVNEENAAGGQVVTAPTNGAAGIIPAVIKHYCTEDGSANRDHIHRFLLTAAAIGMLYKQRASISGAEMGCQGEVGVACSMAAAGLAAVWGGTAVQVEHAAEIGMEHNLGLTCDPVGGLVQIPCIERNAIGAVKAVNAARLALHASDGHKVSLDQVIETMRQTGLDMSRKYKETSEGGLAVNVVEC